MKTLDSLLLSDITTRRVLGITGDCPVNVAARRMGETRISCLVVMDGVLPCGIITERDLVRMLYLQTAPSTPVGEVMRIPVITAPLDLEFRSAYALLRQHGIRHLIAVEADGSLAGVATATDFRLHLGRDGFREIDDLSSFLDPVTAALPPDASLAEALEHMAREAWDYVLIVKNDKPLGILTERDVPLLLAAEVKPAEVTLHEVMSTPVHCIAPGASVAEAAARMAKLRIRHIAVIGSGQRLIGALSQDALIEKLGIEIFDEGALQRKEDVKIQDHQELELRRVLEATGVFAWAYDAQGDCLQLGPNTWSLLGYGGNWRPAGLAGWNGLIHPDDRSRLPSHLRVARALADDRLRETECRLRKSDGTWLPVRIRSRVTRRDGGGRALEVVATIATADHQDRFVSLP